MSAWKRFLLLLVALLVLSGCDGSKWRKEIAAKSYPQEEVFTIPIRAKVESGQYLNQDGYHMQEFYGETHQIVHAAEKAGLTVEYITGEFGTELLLHKDGNFWFWGQMTADRWEFSGMNRPVYLEHQAVQEILVPLHLIPDPAIRESRYAHIEIGHPYMVRTAASTAEELLSEFQRFYDQTAYETEITAQGLRISCQEQETLLTFSVEQEQGYFSVEKYET